MTRFDADTPDERRTLFADAIDAHRERASQFLTVEADPDADHDRFGDGEGGDGVSDDDAADADADLDDPDADDDAAVPPWIQYADGTINLDCTDAELDDLQALVGDYPEFRIERLDSPDTAEGTNVRITAYADDGRLAEFFDRTFREAYGRPEDYRAWVVAI